MDVEIQPQITVFVYLCRGQSHLINVMYTERKAMLPDFWKQVWRDKGLRTWP
jgi:hypothetical protein